MWRYSGFDCRDFPQWKAIGNSPSNLRWLECTPLLTSMIHEGNKLKCRHGCSTRGWQWGFYWGTTGRTTKRTGINGWVGVGLIALEECMTLWGERERMHVRDMEKKWYSHVRHQNVTETPGHRIWHKTYKHMNTGTVSQAMVQWSSPVGTSCMDCRDALHTGSTSCAWQNTWGMVQLTPRWNGHMK